MLDHFSIFTKGGVVLWSYSLCHLVHNPIEDLINSILIEERSGEQVLHTDQHTLRWVFENSMNLVFVAVHQRILQLIYVPEFLELMKAKFCQFYKTPRDFVDLPTPEECSEAIGDFFYRTLKAYEDEARETAKSRTQQGFKSDQKKDGPTKLTKKDKKRLKSGDTNTSESDSTVDASPSELPDEFAQFAVPKPSAKPKKPAKSPPKQETPKKAPRWDDSKLSKEDAAALNLAGEQMEDTEVNYNPTEQFGKTDLEMKQKPEEVVEEKKSGVFGFLSSLATGRELTAEDLEPVSAQFRTHLQSKNVATEIAVQIVDSVQASLVGTKVSSFSRLSTTVRKAVGDALTRILTPDKEVNILRGVEDSHKKGKPYTIVFMGVNGVGKSTNLAKVCYWLIQSGLKVLVAACDTFRSGAVEQVKEHARRLKVDLFDQGYGRDAASVAKSAIQHAEDNGYDVVLVDTAGRMQDNEPLMRSLVKLVTVNNPELILFVGEALVGNDGMDQLKKFNRALADYSPVTPPRLIDGIILTKFDTIDDKVGAAISMVYTPPGQPVVFVGTGQHYTDLKTLHVNTVVSSLLS